MRTRIRVEGALAVAMAVLAVITLINAEWIEFLTGWDPDGGSGALEWGLVLALAAGSLIAGLLARRDYRRSQASALTTPMP